MKKRCNIAKILNHCCNGIKLYDVQRGIPVVFDSIINDDEIRLHEEESGEEIIYNKYATLFNVSVYPNAMHMLIPSANNSDWSHFFIPGDVVIQEDDNMILLVDKVSSDYRHFSALYAIDLRNNEVSQNFNNKCDIDATLFSLVSEERAKNFINDLENKYNGKFDSKLLKVIPHKCNFKPKDWCLMRDTDEGYDKWILCQFSQIVYEDRTYYIAVGGKEYTDCIPYEGNESLLGTNKNP